MQKVSIEMSTAWDLKPFTTVYKHNNNSKMVNSKFSDLQMLWAALS